jgi:hypothetical protein
MRQLFFPSRGLVALDGDNQIGRLEDPEVFLIQRWTRDEILAAHDPEWFRFRCRITLIRIDRKSDTVTWTSEPNFHEGGYDCLRFMALVNGVWHRTEDQRHHSSKITIAYISWHP